MTTLSKPAPDPRLELDARPAGAVAPPLQLDNARVAVTAQTTVSASLAIDGDHVSFKRASSRAADLAGYIVLPGLVNAHDHLEFALFPRLGNGQYSNARCWAEDIYRPDASPIREHLRVPKDVRLWFGGLKNLLSGVTTVQHHNPYEAVFNEEFPVRVARCEWAHSLAFEPDIDARRASSGSDSPFIIHLGEGVDPEARAEFAHFQSSCGIRPNTVLVHGVALSTEELATLERNGGALVWCPSSNLFTLGTTLPSDTVSTFRRMALGTDSPISGAGDMFDEIATACRLGITAERIYDLVTSSAADVLRRKAGSVLGGGADLIVLRDCGETPARSLATATHEWLELVIVGGRVRLISPALRERWPFELPAGLEPIVVEGVEHYVDAPVSRLLARARQHLGRDIRLGHKRVWQ